jgi:AAA domain-containing protein
MSNTRRARADAPLSQERFCSSAEYEQGLLANLVARRCEALDNPAHAELILGLQYLSHQPGGLKKLVRDLCAAFPGALATPTMQKLGMKDGQIYHAEQVKKIRAEIPSGSFDYLLHGEEDEINDLDGSLAKFSRPKSYPARVFVERCYSAALADLESVLMQLCLDPQREVSQAAPWWFPTLIGTLAEFQDLQASAARASLAETEISRQVFETLDYALDGNCLVLSDGTARTGKTHAAKAWCQLRPGRARYVQVPASNDDISFFRAIAKALGVSSALSLKGVQMRERVETVLQSTRLMLVLDEAHYLWPQNNRREALPNRVNWILTALVNYGVPVGFITTPQFARDQSLVEKKTGWASAQFHGRIAYYKPLPERLNADEITAIARHHLPDGDEKSISLLASVAEVSQSYISGIAHAVNRARHEAKKQGRNSIAFADVKKAVQNYAVPTDTALKQVLSGAGTGRPAKASPLPATAPASVTTTQPQPRRSVAPEIEPATTNRISQTALTDADHG